jgi:outer membrane lipoprotein
MSRALIWRLSVMLALAGMLSGCASKVPKSLQQDPPGAPSPRAVQSEPERHVGKTVRWGGEILGVRNETDHTEVEVYGRALFRDGEPRPDGGDGVRFIARIARFLDPAEYRPGKRLTVRGKLGLPLTRLVGEYPYRYPLVEAELSHLWPPYEPPREPPWYRDPYYDPWWPWGPWGPWGPYRHWPYWW